MLDGSAAHSHPRGSTTASLIDAYWRLRRRGRRRPECRRPPRRRGSRTTFATAFASARHGPQFGQQRKRQSNRIWQSTPEGLFERCKRGLQRRLVVVARHGSEGTFSSPAREVANRRWRWNTIDTDLVDRFCACEVLHSAGCVKARAHPPGCANCRPTGGPRLRSAPSQRRCHSKARDGRSTQAHQPGRDGGQNRRNRPIAVLTTTVAGLYRKFEIDGSRYDAHIVKRCEFGPACGFRENERYIGLWASLRATSSGSGANPTDREKRC